MLSWQIFLCLRIAIILKRQVLKNTREITLIYSVHSGNPRHVDPGRRAKSLIFSVSGERRKKFSEDHEGSRKCKDYQGVMNKFVTGTTVTHTLVLTSQICNAVYLEQPR